MSKKKVVNVEKPLDPALPFAEVEIGGRTLKMCLNYRAMALAESKFRAQGHKEVLLLVAAPDPTQVINLQFLFACSLQHFHPEIQYDDAMNMVDPTNQIQIYLALAEVLEKSFVRGEKAAQPDPPPPAQ